MELGIFLRVLSKERLHMLSFPQAHAADVSGAMIVVTQEMQDPVNDVQGKFLLNGRLIGTGMPLGDIRADHDLAFDHPFSATRGIIE